MKDTSDMEKKKKDFSSVESEDHINHWLNFKKAALCSLAFLGLYVAIYSA